MGVIGPWQLLVIVALVVIFFGGKKIPELMRGMGRGIKEFKDGRSSQERDDGSLCARCKTDRRDYQELESCRIRQGPGPLRGSTEPRMCIVC